jgi:hypothetical protein
MGIDDRIDIMNAEKNSVTSDQINKPKKAVAKKAAAKKVAKKVEFKEDAIDGDGDGMVQDGTEHERPVQEVVSNNENLLILFESGAGYATSSGFRFSQTNKMAEVPAEEARLLLSLDNFRLPSDEEKEMYYNNLED